MRKGKLLALIILILGFTFVSLSPVTGKADQGSAKTGGTTKKSTTKKGTKKGGAAGGQLALGRKVFDIHCATCHPDGINTIEPEKSLKMADLKKFGFNGVADVKVRVIEGKGIMPVFKDELKPNEIDAVSAFVWSQAQKGWK